MEQSQATGAIGGGLQGAAQGSAFGPVGAIAGGIIGGAMGFLGGGGEKQAEKLAQEQADLLMRQAKEQQRRLTIQLNQQMGLAKSQVYASGLQMGGSSKKYVNFMESTFRQDMAWNQEVARRNAEIVKMGGSAQSDAIKMAGIGQLFSGLSSAVGAFAPRPKTQTTNKIGSSSLSNPNSPNYAPLSF
jgi:hypothetical protein